MVKFNSHQLRASRLGESRQIASQVPRNPIVLILDHILDTYNIGSFFRLADAIAAQKLYLCGPLVTPPNVKIDRASVGTCKFVYWEAHPTTPALVKKLKQEKYQIIACEQSSRAVNYLTADYRFPLAIIAGSEANGVGESVLKLCDLNRRPSFWYQ